MGSTNVCGGVMKRFIILFMFFIIIILLCKTLFFAKNEDTLEVGLYLVSSRDTSNENQYTFFDNAIDEFVSENNVKVHYDSGIREEDYSEWLMQKILKGETPDVFMILEDDFYNLTTLGVVENLDKYILRDNINTDLYYDSVYEKGQYNNVYALPFVVEPRLMLVNKTLLAENNIDMPSEDWTWNDFYDISSSVTKDIDDDNIIDQFSFYNYKWQDAMYSNGYYVESEEDMYDFFLQKPIVDSVKFYKQLLELNDGQRVTQDDFDSGRVAFMPLPFSEYKTYKTYPYKVKRFDEFEWDCITMPSGPNGDNSSTIGTVLIGINAKSKNSDRAWEFLKFLTYNEDIQQNIYSGSFGSSPLKSVVNSKETDNMLKSLNNDITPVINSKLLDEIMEKSVTTPNIQNYKESIEYAENYILIIDDDVDEKMKIMQENINNIIIK